MWRGLCAFSRKRFAMLKLIEKSTRDTAKQLLPLLPQGLHTAYALFYLLDESAEGGAWVQSVGDSVTALVVQTAHDRVVVAASDAADFEELHLFLRQLGELVECAPALCEKLGVAPFERRSILTLRACPEESSTAVSVYDDFQPIYALLLESAENPPPKESDKAFAHWLSATTRGVFGDRTVVKAVYAGTGTPCGVAVADIFENYVYLRDVATKKAYRRKGYGSDCVRGICQALKTAENEVFLLCANAETAQFYQKLGFVQKTEIELGTIE